MRSVLHRRLQPWIARWRSLPARDQRALGALVLFVVAIVIWMGMVSPLRAWVERAQDDVSAARDDLAWMQANAAAARRVAASGVAGRLPEGQSLLAAVNGSAREAGINLQRFEPDGDHRVRVTLENAVLTDVLRWIVLVEQRHGLVVDSFSADALPQAGVANIRLTLGMPR